MNRLHPLIVTSSLGAALALGPPSPAFATDAAFMLIDSVPGESRDQGHTDWIMIETLRVAAAVPLSAAASLAGRSVCQPFVITKTIDKATPKLYEACAKGTHFPTATLHVMRVDRGQLPYLEIKLSDVLVSAAETTAKSDKPTEQISFVYGKIEYKYLAQKPDGTLDETPVVTSYDCPH